MSTEAKNACTQKLLNEVKKPKHSKRADLEAALIGLLPIIAACSQQATEIQSLAQVAEMVEPDPDLAARIELYVQTAGFMQRTCKDIERSVRDLVTGQRQMDRYDSEVRGLAKEKGYAC